MNQLSENYQRLVDNWEMLLIVAGVVIVSLIFNWLQHGKLRLTPQEMEENDYYF